MNEEEKKMARKNQPCDMDCFNCTRPADRCYGGDQHKSIRVGRYNRMNDGMKGTDMPELHWGRGHKCR